MGRAGRAVGSSIGRYMLHGNMFWVPSSKLDTVADDQ
jgi:hypothetical protein